MTTVQVNKTGTDYIELELTQADSFETTCYLKENILDNALSYHFCVTELSVPLHGTPIFPIKETQRLFRVLRRNVGRPPRVSFYPENPTDYIDNIIPAVNGADVSVYNIHPQYPFFDIGDFCKDLSRWVRGFNYGASLAGIDEWNHGDAGDLENMGADEAANAPYEFLRLSLSCDGSLLLEGFPIFWNNYFIEFTSYGAALLGIDRSLLLNNLLGFTIAQAPTRYVAKAFLDGAGVIIPGGVLQEIIVDTSSPIFETADQRIKITVESHLSVASNTEIIDEQQTVNRDIVEIFFENQVQTETKYDESGRYSGLSLHTKLYSGQHSMVRRSDRHNQWNRLLNAFELRYFRFQLYVTYRLWDSHAEKWKLQRQKMNIPKGTFWVMNIRFVSDS